MVSHLDDIRQVAKMSKHWSRERSVVMKISIRMTNDTRSASLAWSLDRLQFSQETVSHLTIDMCSEK
jgi:hypothetical protein